MNEKEKTYRVISWLLLSTNFISLFLLTISVDFKKLGPFIFSLLAAATVFIGQYFKRKNEKLTYSLAFFIFSLAWFNTVYDWIAYSNLIFFILEPLANRKLSVRFYNNWIIYPSALSKKIFWKDINNALLKDDILTLDLKNNKLVQQKIDRIYTTINEKEFNDFCRQQLKDYEVI